MTICINVEGNLTDSSMFYCNPVVIAANRQNPEKVAQSSNLVEEMKEVPAGVSGRKMKEGNDHDRTSFTPIIDAIGQKKERGL